MATADPVDHPEPAPAATRGVSLSCPLPADRQLSPQDLRQLELQRRNPPPPTVQPAASPSQAASSSSSSAPPSGDPRQRWLRARLLNLIISETEPCPTSKGGTAEVFLELFERVVREPFTDTPGVAITVRVRSIARVLGNITRDCQLQPPLVQSNSGSLVRWNRIPRHRVDIRAWRRQVEASERQSLPQPRQRATMAQVDAALADWIRHHRHLRPVDPSVGESGMALLLLWEVDHNQPFPTAGRTNRTDTLLGFTRRLKRRVAEDQQLSGWLHAQDMHQPIAPGMYPSHHLRWGITIVAPDPADTAQGWYDVFKSRWRAFLAEQALGVHVPTVNTASSRSRSATTASTPGTQPPSPAASSTSIAAADRAANLTSEADNTAQPGRASAPTQSTATASRKRRRAPSSASTTEHRVRDTADSTSSRCHGRPPPPADTIDPTPTRRQGDLRRWIAASTEDESHPRHTRRPGDPRITPSLENAPDPRLPGRLDDQTHPVYPRQSGDTQDPRPSRQQGDLRRWITGPAPTAVPPPAPGHSRAEQGPVT